MSSPPPPTKPPRGVKQGKETSGLLMSVIRTLSASESDEQRGKERRRLERELARSDERLGALVGKHEAALARVAAVAAAADSALAAADARAAGAAARLDAADRLLRPRGPDLRDLWRDARAHHHALLLLARADLLVAREREARDAVAAGRVLRAARLLADTRDAEPPAPALAATVDRLRAGERDLVADLPRRLCRALLAEPERPARPAGESAPDSEADPADPTPALAAAAALGNPPEIAARFAERLPAELTALAMRARCEPGADAAAALEERLGRLRYAWVSIAARLSRAAPELVSPARYWAAVEEATLAAVREPGDADAGGGVSEAAEAESSRDTLAEQFGRRRAARRGRLYLGSGAGAGVRAGGGGARADVLGAAVRGVRAIAECAEAGGGGTALRSWAAAAGRAGAAREVARAAARVSALSLADWSRPHPGQPSLATAAVCAWEAIEEAAEWARGAAWCCGPARGATRAALDALLRQLDAAALAAQPPRTDPAARLLADDDFARFLASLPQYRAATGGPDPAPDELRAALRREADALAAALPPRDRAAPPPRDCGPLALLAESAAWLADRARSLPAPGVAARADEVASRSLLLLRLELRAHVMARAAEGDEGGARLAAEARLFRERLRALRGARSAYVWRGLGAAAAAAAVRAGAAADALRRGLRGAGAGAGPARAAWVWALGARVRREGAGALCALRAGRAGAAAAGVSASDAASAVLAGGAGDWSPERRRRALREVEVALGAGGRGDE